MAIACNCSINEISRFARKNYYYPDLPKNYQISQYGTPVSEHGWVEIETQKELGGSELRAYIWRKTQES